LYFLAEFRATEIKRSDSAKKYKDKRSVATCYYHLALIAKQKNQNQEFHEWSILARNEFEKLGMTQAADKIKQNLESKE
ncbi:MAG: hypothetical protein AAFQ74_12590, partial [Cyanobacteria bacterium J06623_4]